MAFVPSRLGLDNMIIAQEIIHTISGERGQVGYMAIKIDLEKAYDRLEWHFVRDMLHLYKFPKSLTKLILSCVSTSSISVLLNGAKLESFLPSLGIRQGDHLSLYLFIICMEMMGFLIDLKCKENLWDPIKASRYGPAFSHLFFAYDLVLFAKADMKNCCNVRETLDTFCELSRLKVSFRHEQREEMYDVLGMRSTPNLGKYLGFPLNHFGSTSHDFDFVIVRVHTKL